MKVFKELKEQYAWLWWWLLDQGLLVATILVNFFMATVFAVAMAVLYFVLKHLGKH